MTCIAKVRQFLKLSPDKAFTPAQLMKELDINHENMRAILNQLRWRGQICRVKHGHYQSIEEFVPSGLAP